MTGIEILLVGILAVLIWNAGFNIWQLDQIQREIRELLTEIADALKESQ